MKKEWNRNISFKLTHGRSMEKSSAEKLILEYFSSPQRHETEHHRLLRTVFLVYLFNKQSVSIIYRPCNLYLFLSHSSNFVPFTLHFYFETRIFQFMHLVFSILDLAYLCPCRNLLPAISHFISHARFLYLAYCFSLYPALLFFFNLNFKSHGDCTFRLPQKALSITKVAKRYI